MVFTKSQAKAAFNHAMDNVIGKDDTSPLKKAIIAYGIEEIHDLTTMVDSDIDDLVYNKSATETNVHFSRPDRQLLRAFISYVGYTIHNGNALSDSDEWEAITRDDFSDYRIRKFNPALRQFETTTPDSTPTIGTTGTVSTMPRNPAELLRRGMKRDSTLFPVLKDEKFNDTWHRTFVNQARAQDIMEVLNPDYVPSTTEEMELFDEKQKYLYAVLEQKVLTDWGLRNAYKTVVLQIL